MALVFHFHFFSSGFHLAVVSYLKDLGLLSSTHFPLFFHFLLARMTFTYGNWWDGVFFPSFYLCVCDKFRRAYLSTILLSYY